MAFINKVENTNNIGNVVNNKNKADGSFEDLLKKELDTTNNMMQNAEKAEADIATGKVEDLAKASITIQKAEMQMKMVLEVRNKAINAYKELLKTQI
ncbi:flagellar hook-basal body complex protein (FliE) [Nautilia profundicola AmH]|uniref:Flagellar hook-basal body complex protein FliE n=1 Tax=Nautilia profundicola (strain ATCC BAA-1463 / DSM 18972 / AmH) TaxID=598659 RepID=B9L6U6_NAUPA|nr:flagellar hook-basal body complex protein FliE [Nautilia profundicola]ACM92274.1 flagellar hook-basal body complex protein (FliE) [Nautilia profundicola AmH]